MNYEKHIERVRKRKWLILFIKLNYYFCHSKFINTFCAKLCSFDVIEEIYYSNKCPIKFNITFSV